MRRDDEIGDLDVVLALTLSVESQFNQVCSKANRVLGLVTCVSRYLWQPSVMRFLYDAFVWPHLEYSSVVWCPHQTYLVERVNVFQNRLLRLVGTCLGHGYQDVLLHDIVRELILLPMEWKRFVQDIIFIYKIMNNIVDCPNTSWIVEFLCADRGKVYRAVCQPASWVIVSSQVVQWLISSAKLTSLHLTLTSAAPASPSSRGGCCESLDHCWITYYHLLFIIYHLCLHTILFVFMVC